MLAGYEEVALRLKAIRKESNFRALNLPHFKENFEISFSNFKKIIYQKYVDIPGIYNIQLQISNRNNLSLRKLEEGSCKDACACVLL